MMCHCNLSSLPKWDAVDYGYSFGFIALCRTPPTGYKMYCTAKNSIVSKKKKLPVEHNQFTKPQIITGHTLDC